MNFGIFIWTFRDVVNAVEFAIFFLLCLIFFGAWGVMELKDWFRNRKDKP